MGKKKVWNGDHTAIVVAAMLIAAGIPVERRQVRRERESRTSFNYIFLYYLYSSSTHSVPRPLGPEFSEIEARVRATFRYEHRMVSEACCMLRSFVALTETWLFRSVLLFLKPLYSELNSILH